MNETIKLIQSHRSIRRYQDKAIDQAMLDTIIKSAQSAASSSFLQCVSIIRITDQKKRLKLVELCSKQAYVATAAEFLVFCIDYHRHQRIVPEGRFGFTEQTLIGAVDAGLMAQNAMLTAQSLGLGAVFIGALRNDPKAICDLLQLPEQVFPLFGLCLGYPDQNPEQKPRLPSKMVVHENSYAEFKSEDLAAYNEAMKAYYQARTGDAVNQRNWSSDMREKLQKEARPYMQDCLHSQGLCVR